MGEGLLLLALVTLPAMLICYNVGIGGVHHWTYRIDCHLAGGVEHDTLPDRLAGSLAVDSADGDDGHLVSGTASYEDRAGRGAA